MQRLKPGTAVTPVMGVDGGKRGVVLDRREVPTDGRGIPKIHGCYYPMKRHEVAVRFEDGTVAVHSIYHLAGSVVDAYV